jgi:hypothetical protein
MVAWIAQNPGTSYKNKIRTQVISTENTRTRRPEAAGDVKLTSQITIELFVMQMYF